MIGIDIEKNARFATWDEKKLKRVFSSQEIAYARSKANPLEHLCGFFCVKEALVKALSRRDLVFNKLMVLHDEEGKPYIEKNEYLSSILNENNFKSIDVSISHTSDTSTAIVCVN